MSASLSHAPWVIDLVLDIDAASSSFCGNFLRTSDEKRQVISAYLAHRAPSGEHYSDVANFLLRSSHGAILADAFGEAPKGLRGALRRSGPVVHDKRFYGVLYRLLAKPRHTEIVRCISRLNELTLFKLRVVNILPPELCRPNVVEAVETIESATDLVASVDLIAAAGGDREKLCSAIQKVRSELTLARVVGRALLDCQGVAHPVPPTDGYRPIETARDLHKIAAKFRNCARSYTIDLLDHDAGHAFAEVRKGVHTGVAHLRQRDGKWSLEGLYGPRNIRPASALRQHTIEHLQAHGVHQRERSSTSNSKWNHVRRMTTMPMMEFEFA